MSIALGLTSRFSGENHPDLVLEKPLFTSILPISIDFDSFYYCSGARTFLYVTLNFGSAKLHGLSIEKELSHSSFFFSFSYFRLSSQVDHPGVDSVVEGSKCYAEGERIRITVDVIRETKFLFSG